MGKWMLLFFLTPLVEMYLLITVGGYIGAVPTIALVVMTAIVGVALLRVQGFRTLARGLERANRGELPGSEIAEGLLLAVCGALMLTPGFVTDAIGFVLLVPAARRACAAFVLARVQVATFAPNDPFGDATAAPFESGPSKPSGRTIIDADFRREE